MTPEIAPERKLRGASCPRGKRSEAGAPISQAIRPRGMKALDGDTSGHGARVADSARPIKDDRFQLRRGFTDE